MSEMPSMPFFVDDYEAATSHLTLEEDGLYNRLLRLCWRTAGCSVPDDKGWLLRHLRLSSEDFDRVAAPIIVEFFTSINGRLSQKRQQREFAYVKDIREKRKSAGRKGGLGGVVSKPLKSKETKPSKPQAPTPTLTPTLFEESSPSETSAQARDPEPRQILMSVLDEETTDAVLKHRRAKRAPLTTALAARGLIKAFSEYPGGVRAAAEMMVTNGWTGFKRDYWDKGPTRAGPAGRRMSKVEELGEELRQEIGSRIGLRAQGREEGRALQPPQGLLAIGGKA